MRNCFVILLLSSVMTASGQNRENPVIKRVADAGVLKYAGKYYLGGVATHGDFYVSSDLTHWDQRIHVFDLDNKWTHGTGARNNQVHADDITYSNGQFHLLFSVNYWGPDRHIVHITHATSPTITGPFREVRDDQWFENRIDPQVFRDEDGRLYLYMVKFTDGNTIWGRPMNQDFSFCGEAVQQFSSQPGTWETLDNRVAEGPFVVKYRGKYYMMYNANHTAHTFGNYRLGVCEADSPLGFNPGGKYSHPVVGPKADHSLWDMYVSHENDSLFTPGQPNIVRGPNGWEWWLVYMANKGRYRDQYVDRIHFTNNRLTVDGITDKLSEGFHPLPSLPQYCGTSLEGISPSDSYLLELTFKPTTPSCGILIGNHRLLLPEEMGTDVSHQWRIERNAALLTVWIDDVLVEDHVAVIGDGMSWLGGQKESDVEYVSYTNGWDEWGCHFSGWEGSNTTADGLFLPKGAVFKGKAADDYELSVMFENIHPESGVYGVYAAWQDSRNYVRVTIDAPRQSLVVEQCEKGKIRRMEKPLARSVVHYPDIKYSDTYEKQYRFDSPTYLSAITMPKYDADNDPYASALSLKEGSRQLRVDMASTQHIDWLDGDNWRPLKYQQASSGYDELQTIMFPQIKTQALRFINKDPQSNNRYLYRIETRHDFASINQLRIDKRGKAIHIFVDDSEQATVCLSKPAATRIGLFSDTVQQILVRNILYYQVK